MTRDSSDNHFFKLETWKVLWTLLRSSGSSSLYATGPIRSRILHGTMYRGLSFPYFANRMIPLRACKRCRICTIFSVVSWTIYGPENSTNGLTQQKMTVEGLRSNARGPGLVTFGPDRVMEFCNNNNLQLIVRANECVMDGFEHFAQGHLITLFSATNYCGTANNAGAILVLGRDLVVVPKLIHPLPLAISSPETSPERHIEYTWMQELNANRPPIPTRGRPQVANEHGHACI
ncbi:serine/threonine-protein phosphatase BSL3-like protein [Tanacetum coccineum]|uniref:Serine/threonine-protein phosphatase BSL3-like protein n=1 Tax=Tanacetum coccineum TaxID=301880 RepID=A0ABQ4XWF3_9ASTR